MNCKQFLIWRIEFCNDPVVKKPNILQLKQKSWCYLLNTHFSVVCIIFEMSSLSANLLMYFFAPVCFCYFCVRTDIEIYSLWLWWTLPSKAYTEDQVVMMPTLWSLIALEVLIIQCSQWQSWHRDSSQFLSVSCHYDNFVITGGVRSWHYDNHGCGH